MSMKKNNFKMKDNVTAYGSSKNNGVSSGTTDVQINGEKTNKTDSVGKNKEKCISVEQPKIIIKRFKVSCCSINASIAVFNGKRYGLTGLDSSGKTTVLQHMENEAVHIPPDMDVINNKSKILQEDLTVFDAVVKAPKKYDYIFKEYEELKIKQEQQKAKHKEDNLMKERKERLVKLRQQLLMVNPDEYPAIQKALKILSGLGISEEELDIIVKNIPPSRKSRIYLARALFLEPDLLLLDEPSAELDVDAVLWLGNYLQVYSKALIVVTQDRCLMDKICNEILHIDPQNMLNYKGNFSIFEEKYLKRQQKKLKRTASGELGDVKTRSKAMSKNLEEAKVRDSKVVIPSIQMFEKPEFSFCNPVSPKLTHFMVLNGVSYSYEKKALFVNLNESINCRSRIAVLGPSRAGKSTLLKLATKELDPEKGKVHLNDGIKIGCFGENSIGKLPENETPLEYIEKQALKDKDKNKSNLKQEVAKHLRKLGLAESSLTTRLKDLSDSEKARVSLAELCFVPYDCLFMDEPTRHLDIDLIDALTDAINRYNGGLVMVSNNEYLIRETECELGFFERGELCYVVDFDYYKKKLLFKLDEPIRGPSDYTRRTSSKLVTSSKIISDSVIIEDYIKNSNADPSIKEIGKYTILFDEGTKGWSCYPPTLTTRCKVSGRTKEICEEAVREAIEREIEELIKYKQEVPPPP